jgi:hypothetical protein
MAPQAPFREIDSDLNLKFEIRVMLFENRFSRRYQIATDCCVKSGKTTAGSRKKHFCVLLRIKDPGAQDFFQNSWMKL